MEWKKLLFPVPPSLHYGRMVSFILIATDTLWKVIPKKKIFAEGIIILICVIHFCLVWFSYMGIEYQIWLKDWTQNVVQKRALETPEDAIFLTSQYDKFIFPYRKTYIYTSLAKMMIDIVVYHMNFFKMGMISILKQRKGI